MWELIRSFRDTVGLLREILGELRVIHAELNALRAEMQAGAWNPTYIPLLQPERREPGEWTITWGSIENES